MKISLGRAALVVGGVVFCAISAVNAKEPPSRREEQKIVQPAGATPGYRGETEAQLQAIPPCQAAVEKTTPCAVFLITRDGKRLHIGGPGATPEVARFVRTLKMGQTFIFPDAFLEFQKRSAKG
ncbi:MAG: hypothetical protein ACR2OZ_17190 [Verrucomicrobiales bacterium]